jgi:hypothetical protein
MKERVENVCSSSTNHSTWIIAISISLKKFRNECLKVQETSNVHQSCVKGLTWNGTSIVATTLDFMVILNMLDYISKPHGDKMDGQILATLKNVLEFESLMGSKCHLVQ